MSDQVIRIDDQTWRIEDNGVRCFLLAGSEWALLVDSGMTLTNIREIAESVTSLPIRLLNTHADMDHVCGNGGFETFYMHPSEYGNYFSERPVRDCVIPLWDGDVIDPGGRPLRVIGLPGHTPGSIGLLDESRRALVGGDPIQDGEIFMFGTWRNILAYKHSLMRLEKFADMFDTVYPSHGTFPVPADIIPKLIEGAEKIINGEIPWTAAEFMGTPLRRYDVGVAAFLCDG